jgi:hypothetical protein
VFGEDLARSLADASGAELGDWNRKGRPKLSEFLVEDPRFVMKRQGVEGSPNCSGARPS